MTAAQPQDEFSDNLIKNVLTTFIVPELNRRQRSGQLPDDFEFYAGQILMEVGQRPEIRFNEDVRGVFLVHPESEVDQDRELRIAEFPSIAGHVQGFRLETEDRPDCGHITLIRNPPGWFITFDLRYNSARIAEHLSAIREYLGVAEECLSTKRLRAFASNLFVAVELMAKARLMVHPDERMLTSRKHKFTASEFNRFAKQGNVEQRFADLLNALTGLRNPARYPEVAFGLELPQAHTMLDDAKAMWAMILGESPDRAIEIAGLGSHTPPSPAL